MKKSIYLLCCTLLIFSCSKNKSKSVQNNNTTTEYEKTAEEVNGGNSFIAEQKEENTIAFQMEPIDESISKPFIYDFPEIINFDYVPNYTYSIADFTDEEKLFYEKYVGCYLSEREFSKDYISSYLSEIRVNFIENGIIFWGFRKSRSGIHYDANEKKFYDYGTFDTTPIENLAGFKLPEYYKKNGYKKFTDCRIVEDIISEKKEKMNRSPLTELQEQKVRNFLTDFFTMLSKKEFDEIIDNFFVSKNDRDKVKDTLFWQAYELEYQNDSFDIYINVFFNDNIEKYTKDTIFVELKYGHPINYVSFAIKEINDQLKIQKYIARYDGE